MSVSSCDELSPSDGPAPLGESAWSDGAPPGDPASSGEVPPDELGLSEESLVPVVSANATGIQVVIAAPMPKATAKAPTRPM
ncbi:hypothetical protein ASE48_07620 [Mycobacterium sp. Root265]|uniref:hypothetical protein n=1 Tax=Mycobacterium sp. Root265 TaxID=1736504 RepID=UPI00070C2E85|nr:hypothetical protein [Mycobacterium sp. Root265]KRD08441.1 hypothetical protein ASE48_07620 [Mycobacterium sp. Root265]